jgi:NADP-dependent 3-hydroxy acid dehydrogenase YdfG
MNESPSTPPAAPHDRVLVITGASSGIGAATARAAVQHGWRVVLGARSIDRLTTLSEELGGPERALAVRCDVREWDELQQLTADAMLAFGRIDAGFANAGFGAERGFEASTPEHWRDMVLTNVYGCALTIRALLPALRASRGHMLLTSSVAGRRVLPGSLYSATKFAVSAMGEALRQEVADAGVRVTLISPGMTDTPFFDDGTPSWALTDTDVAGAVVYAIQQPQHVNISEVLMRPTAQSF